MKASEKKCIFLRASNPGRVNIPGKRRFGTFSSQQDDSLKEEESLVLQHIEYPNSTKKEVPELLGYVFGKVDI